MRLGSRLSHMHTTMRATAWPLLLTLGLQCRAFAPPTCVRRVGGGRRMAGAFTPGAGRCFAAAPLTQDPAGSPSASTTPTMASRGVIQIRRDVLVVGGGLAGLSTALELARRGRQVTVLSRDGAESASLAAGGMLAPQAERLEEGPYLDLCLSSRAMYSDWLADVEAIAGLGEGNADAGLGANGGFLAPAFEGDAVHRWKPPPGSGQSYWYDRKQVLELEPRLSPEVVGGWVYPQDMCVDAQKLFGVLEQACVKAGVEILHGAEATSFVFDKVGQSVDAVALRDGRRIRAKSFVAATGAWMSELVGLPMEPHKGQMMSLKLPESAWGQPLAGSRRGAWLGHVLFAEGSYVIPRPDNRIVLGATVEPGEWDLHNTPVGIRQLVERATRVCPDLGGLAVERTWAGLRPTTPDFQPVLGASGRGENLFLAGGYWRNGVLLAPRAGQLVADAVMGELSPKDAELTEAFSADRFSGNGPQAVVVGGEAFTAAAPGPPGGGVPVAEAAAAGGAPAVVVAGGAGVGAGATVAKGVGGGEGDEGRREVRRERGVFVVEGPRPEQCKAACL